MIDRPVSPPIAAESLRSAELADACCKRLAECLTPSTQERVTNLVHCQCTLDQQVLGSTCLRIGFAHFPSVTRAITVGQLGTGGVPTALVLARTNLLGGLGATVVTAADKWMDPFERRYGDLVTFGDGAGALFVDAHDETRAALAVVHGITTHLVPQGRPFWDRPIDSVADEIIVNVTGAIGTALAQAGWTVDTTDLLVGENYGCGIPERIAAIAGFADKCLLADRSDAHASSSAFIDNLMRTLALSAEQNRSLRCAIWSASLSGAIALTLVECDGRHATGDYRERLSVPAATAS
ncbi:hypothetical protein [Tahibacter amnicola]|uniref:3-oxoacyl-[acyl-carrier-protein] synthase-3 n=1 Tax=Tahibacter amnicola TaxID=2976241 RepID=A0ABY6B7Y2_9GAMM|nr:hypothetical protein [Tahibacter amnicola]UXI66198.1 hypothetical protein N4264_15725 [Tahibacter amnicola]